jgi:hypothetical protein
MAGRGPAPGANPNRKDPSQRRRRNVEPTFEDLPAEGYQGDFPPLPATWSNTVLQPVETGDGEQEMVPVTVKMTYLKLTREWYETWARSPMAVRFTQVDWMRLRQIAPLIDQYNRRPRKDLASELRLQESVLGATVMDRQRMRLRVGKTEEPGEQDEPQEGKGAQVRRLRAV